MFRWYAVNTYSGHENKVKQNLEHRVVSLGQERNVRQIVIPTEQVSEIFHTMMLAREGARSLLKRLRGAHGPPGEIVPRPAI